MSNTLLPFRRGRPTRTRESGQAMAEYSLFTFFMLVGVVMGVGGFLPASFAAYRAYIDGFWLVLGLPIP
jgi:hypothetical protein